MRTGTGGRQAIGRGTFAKTNCRVQTISTKLARTAASSCSVNAARYEELPDTPEWQDSRALAYNLLQRYAMWWEPAYDKTIYHGTERPLVPIFYRIHITRITGHCATH
ncbi:MAG: hypothetical protein ABSD31_10110 [Candidatus Binataceae bacterium]